MRRVDYFISHAWRSSRVTKYFALCRFFNMSAALAVAGVYNLAWFLYVIHFATSGVQDVRHDFVDGTPHTTPRLLRYAVAAGPVIVLLCAAPCSTSFTAEPRASSTLRACRKTTRWERRRASRGSEPSSRVPSV